MCVHCFRKEILTDTNPPVIERECLDCGYVEVGVEQDGMFFTFESKDNQPTQSQDYTVSGHL